MIKHEALSEYISDLERALIKDDMKKAVEIEAAMIAFHTVKVEAARIEVTASKPFWVVERYLVGKLHYWSAGARGRGHADDWATDIQWATKLADQESADQVMCRLLDGEGRSARHSFLSTREQLAETSRFMAENAL